MPREPNFPQRVAVRPPAESVESVIAAHSPLRSTRPSIPAAIGGERHATRRLDVRKGPTDGSAIVATIDTAMMVEVMRADGRWRYVKSSGSKAEGWVDGTYLAGETPAAASGAGHTLAPMRGEPRLDLRHAATPPLPPIGISASTR